MTGFFTFRGKAVDDGNNEAFADAQVVIIATENQIFLTFNNPIGYVTQYDADVSLIRRLICIFEISRTRTRLMIFDNLADKECVRFGLSLQLHPRRDQQRDQRVGDDRKDRPDRHTLPLSRQ